MEVWKDIEGCQGYQVSDLGRVKCISKGNEVIRKTNGVNSSGYQVVSFNKYSKNRSQTVHRLVAMAFIPNPENKKEVNHINGIKTDTDQSKWSILDNSVKFDGYTVCI